ncbi:glycosyltransferase family 2 protein [Microbacterium sp.]|uniref:glycosyltransferase family 2 protein n=1 Tax=Microbacterium sp. TaxID=51671 RepID=UPI003C72593B
MRYDDVSLVICTRERPEMLRTALESFRANTPADVQILVVDSASTTSQTREVARDVGVDYVRTDTRGLSIARNVGLRTSQRPIVVFTDDDCQAIEGWLEPLLDHFDDLTVASVTGTMLDHTLVGRPREARPIRRFTRTTAGIDAGHGAIMAFRREYVLGLGGFDPVLGAGRKLAGAEDLDIFCRMLYVGHQIVSDPGCVVLHVNTREDAAYTKLHRGYGLGLGALTNKWLRMHTREGVMLAAIVLKRTISRIVRERADARRRNADVALLRGFLRGILIATSLRRVGTVFVDAHPPTPIALREAENENGGSAQ